MSATLPAPLPIALDGAPAVVLSEGMARDLAIDPNTRELVLVDGDLALARGSESIRQDADMRLRFLLGEWFLDETVGVPYLERVLGKRGGVEAAVATIREALLQVPGVVSVARVSATYDGQRRSLAVSWAVQTSLGALTSSTTIETP